jgi:hypothetical protein
VGLDEAGPHAGGVVRMRARMVWRVSDRVLAYDRARTPAPAPGAQGLLHLCGERSRPQRLGALPGKPSIDLSPSPGAPWCLCSSPRGRWRSGC